MKVELATLQSNPYRDFQIDPLEEDAADDLKQSINDTGFWGGVPVRKTKDGTLQIGAGHKRVYAAINAGIKVSDLVVKSYSDEEMIRIYATENVTQRGTNAGLAMTGAVAAAVRYLVKGVLKNEPTVRKYFQTVNGFETTRHQIASEKGLGRDVVFRFFQGISGMNDGLVKEHLAQLKASGDYARIVKEVSEEIAKEEQAERDELERLKKEAEEAEQKAAQKAKEAEAAKAKAEQDKAIKPEAKEAKAEADAAKDEAKGAKAKLKEKEGIEKTKELAEKAVAAAAKKEVTFDLKGVGKWLKSQSQIRTFRKVMTLASIHKSVPVSRQGDLAAWLVHRANTNNQGKLTANFITDNLPDLIMGATMKDLKLGEQELAEIEWETARENFAMMAHHFCRNLAGVMRDAKGMIDLKDKYPALKFKITQELIDAVQLAEPKVIELRKKLKI
jgi:ParB-like chromosome segregation protein Spo0J